MKQAPQHEPGDSTSVGAKPSGRPGAGHRHPRAGRTFADPADVEPRSPRGRGYSNQLGSNRAMEDGILSTTVDRAHGLATWADAGTKVKDPVQHPVHAAMKDRTSPFGTKGDAIKRSEIAGVCPG